MSKPRFESVFIASYPRSGNTLVRSILWNCFGLRSNSRYVEGDTLLSSREISNMVGSVLADTIHDVKDLIAKQGILPHKTHDISASEQDMPAIYIIRDGREVVCSYLDYEQRRVKDGVVTMEEVIRGHVEFGSWSDHIIAWHPFDRPNTLFLRYEELISSERHGLLPTRFETCIKRIGDFIGIEPLKTAIPSFGAYRSALPGFFRSGTNQTWRDLLTGRDLQLFYELHGDMMAAWGYSAPHCAGV